MANLATPVPDLYGRALLDYAKGRRLPVHLRRGDGRLLLLDFEPYVGGAGPGAISPMERSLFALARGSVLDLGAGGGRVAAYLQSTARPAQAVTEVIAVDSSQGACICLRRRGLRAVVHSPWQRVMESGIWRGRFDTVLLAGGNLGLAEDEAGLARMLEWLGGLLRPDGRLLVTAVSPWPPRDEAPAAPVRLRIEYDGKVGEWFSWLTLTPAALWAAASEHGLLAISWVFPPDYGEYGALLAKAGPAPAPARRLVAGRPHTGKGR